MVRNRGMWAVVDTLAVLILSGTAVGASGQTVVRMEIQDEQAMTAWLLDEASGRIFAVPEGARGDGDEGTDSVVEFDPTSGKRLRELKIGGNPRRMIVKGKELIVADSQDDSLSIVNLATNAVAGQIKVGGRVAGMCVADPQSPYVYALVEYDFAPGLAQIDLVKREVRTNFRFDNHQNLSDMHDFVMSGDGRFLLARSGPSDVNRVLVEVQAPAERLELLGPLRALVCLPARRCLRVWNESAGKPAEVGHPMERLMLRDMQERSGMYAVAHPKLDLMARYLRYKPAQDSRKSPDKIEFQMQTRSTGAALKSFEVEGQGPDRYSGGELQIQFDAAHDRLFFGWHRTGLVIDLASLKLETHPAVVLDLPGFVKLRTGQKFEMPIALTNADLLGQAKFELLKSPAGAAIADRKVVWTPRPEQVGETRFIVKAATREASDELEVTVRVARDYVELAVEPTLVEVDDGGRYALVVGRAAARDDDRGPGAEKHELVLVDLSQRKVLARKKMDQPPAAVRLTSDAALVAAQATGSVSALSLKDLSKTGRAFVKGHINAIELLPGGRVAIGSNQEVAAFDAKTLKKIDWPGSGSFGSDERFYGDEIREPLLTDLGKAVRFGSLVLDAQTGKPRMMVADYRLPSLDAFGGRRIHLDRHVDMSSPLLWARRLTHDGIYNHAGTRVGAWEVHGWHVLRDYPVVVTATASNRAVRQEERVELAMEIRDLVDGTVQRKLRLLEEPGRVQRSYDYGGPRPAIGAGGNMIAVGYLGKLFLVPIDAETLKKVPPPLELALTQGDLETPIGPTLEWTLTTSGGSGQNTFELLTAQPGLSLDERSGKLSIDTAAVWNGSREPIDNYFQGGVEDRSSDLVADAQSVYKQLFGKATAELPVTLAITAAVRDEQGQVDQATYQLVMLAPLKQLQALAKSGKQANGRIRTVPQQVKQAVDSPGPEGPDVANQLAQLSESGAQLDKRIAQLDETLSQISRRVGELKSAKEQPPAAGAAPAEAQLAQLDEGLRKIRHDLEQMDAQVAKYEQTLANQQTQMIVVPIAVLGIAAVAIGVSLMLLLRRSKMPAGAAPPGDVGPGDVGPA